MKTRALAAAMAFGWTTWLVGCGGSQARPEDEVAEILPSSQEAVDQASASSSPVEREFWLAMAEEPGWHLKVAQDDFLHGQSRKASEELEKVAAMLNFESRHSHSQRERGLLLASVQELREVARNLALDTSSEAQRVSIQELDRVSALAFRAIAAHQVTLGRDALEAGDPRAAGLYIQETVAAVLNGFDRSGIERSPTMDVSLEAAREVGQRLAQDGDGSRKAGMDALDQLDTAVETLTNVLTSRRK
jgi:hypothetical protein